MMQPIHSIARAATAGLLTVLLLFHGIGCMGRARELDDVIELLETHADAVVLQSDTGERVVVSPRLNGRIMSASAGAVRSTGHVPARTIAEGETHPHFNNFGGMDRFWLGPEAGQFGLYFPVGATSQSRENWQVPAALDRGAFQVVERTSSRVVLERPMSVENLSGTRFDVAVRREVGVLTRDEIERELGVAVPDDVSLVGLYSAQRVQHTGARPWTRETGLLGIWVLGMFRAGDRTVIIAPTISGDESALGPLFNDEYFGKVSVDAPDRIAVLDDAILLRADARRVSKFGLSARRTTGLAGAYDFDQDLLTIVRFDLPPDARSGAHLYANSQWELPQAAPYGGDAFQTYNHGVAESPGTLADDVFFELESASPVLALAPGEALRHRHATFHFQGPRPALRELARELLRVDLDRVETLIFSTGADLSTGPDGIADAKRAPTGTGSGPADADDEPAATESSD